MTPPPPLQTRLITTAIPYVNARPHLGFAMELVLADVMARHHRLRGTQVRFLTGTDENSLKNVRAAEAEGVSTADLVDRNAAAFEDLRLVLDLSFDDFIRTSAEARHRRGVERLWRACEAAGDIYKRTYRGLYCVGCEHFFSEDELDTRGCCPEHGVPPEPVEEENYFFRLSKYQKSIESLLAREELAVQPENYRRELLNFVRRGLEDFSISRSATRAAGWGIPVPGDPTQVMYVWFDALGNYISALDYERDGELFRRFWGPKARRTHVIGKGITRFHAVYWPAMLLSAGLALPSELIVHGYLTVDGQKIGKSLGNAVDPRAIVDEFGCDPLRYYLCRHVRSGRDGDFSTARLAQARESELGNQLGNLLHRSVAMIERWYGGRVPAPYDEARSEALESAAVRAGWDYAAAMEDSRLDAALDAIWSLVDAANHHVVDHAPWTLAKRRTEDERTEARLATSLYELAEALRLISRWLTPFMPTTAARLREQLGLEVLTPLARDLDGWGGLAPQTRLRPGPPLFPRTLETGS